MIHLQKSCLPKKNLSPILIFSSTILSSPLLVLYPPLSLYHFSPARAAGTKAPSPGDGGVGRWWRGGAAAVEVRPKGKRWRRGGEAATWAEGRSAPLPLLSLSPTLPLPLATMTMTPPLGSRTDCNDDDAAAWICSPLSPPPQLSLPLPPAVTTTTTARRLPQRRQRRCLGPTTNCDNDTVVAWI